MYTYIYIYTIAYHRRLQLPEGRRQRRLQAAYNIVTYDTYYIYIYTHTCIHMYVYKLIYYDISYYIIT